MITVEAKRVGARVIATVKVGIGTGHHTYTVLNSSSSCTGCCIRRVIS